MVGRKVPLVSGRLGHARNLSYVDVDMDVKLTLDDDDEVTRIDIL